ncbi:MAG: rhlE [Bacteroidota bacterium]|jgi:ATP-dependent RNA helicase RhlE|nr:rhlE [Bacteroidota bacterium]
MFKEKLHKNLAAALAANGFDSPKPLQLKCIPKINGGSDLIGIGPDSSGKSSTVLISAIQKLVSAFEDAPRALILVPDEEKALQLMDQFKKLASGTDLRAELVVDSGKIDKQTEAIYFGTDIVIGTAKRIMEIYIRKNFNITKIKILAFDDADEIAKLNVFSYLERLSLSLPKCQHLVFAKELNVKVEKITDKFLINPTVVEVNE